MFFYVSYHENAERDGTCTTHGVLERTKIAREKEKGQTKFEWSDVLSECDRDRCIDKNEVSGMESVA